MARSTKPRPPSEQEPQDGTSTARHVLDEDEAITASRATEDGLIAVTTSGRKVLMDGDEVVTRLVGPPYDWE